jgi:hypothetical protein
LHDALDDLLENGTDHLNTGCPEDDGNEDDSNSEADSDDEEEDNSGDDTKGVSKCSRLEPAKKRKI